MTERQAGKIIPFFNGLAYILSKRWHINGELHGNACKEYASMADISNTF
jgi:hypothetical protein